MVDSWIGPFRFDGFCGYSGVEVSSFWLHYVAMFSELRCDWPSRPRLTNTARAYYIVSHQIKHTFVDESFPFLFSVQLSRLNWDSVFDLLTTNHHKNIHTHVLVHTSMQSNLGSFVLE